MTAHNTSDKAPTFPLSVLVPCAGCGRSVPDREQFTVKVAGRVYCSRECSRVMTASERAR